MQLGLTLGYWGRGMPDGLVELAAAAERAGFDAAWTGESWGSDAFSPLVLIAAATERVRLGTGVAQLAARTPTATAMHAVTLDHISGGRAILGLGVSGPQGGWRVGTAGPRCGLWLALASTSRSCGGSSSAATRSCSQGSISGTPTPARARRVSASR